MTAAVQINFPPAPQGTRNAINTIAELRAIDSTDVDVNTEVLVAAQGFYKFDPSSLAADDGSTVVKPTDLTTLQAGRWLVVLLSSAGLVSFDPAGTGAVTETVQNKLRQIVNATDYGFATASTGAQNATALANAIAALTSGGIVYIGPGTFTLNTVTVPSNITLQGAGRDATIIVQGAITTTGATNTYGVLYAMSASYTTYVENIAIRDLTIKATAGTFSEFAYLMAMSGVRNLLIERAKFQGFQGDGLFLGGRAQGVTPSGAADYRHNLNVTVRDCVFDGVNNQNRNAITVEDGTGVLIENNSFKNCTKTGMPGAVDFEPNAQALYALGNLEVIGNTFEAVGGSVGVIALQVPAAVTAIPVGLHIAGNRFINCRNEIADISLNMARTFTNSDPDQAIIITGNTGYGGIHPYAVFSAKGVRVDHSNVWEHYDFGTLIGASGITPKPYGCTLMPTLKDCGFAGAQVFRGDYLTFGGSYCDTATVAIFFDGVAAAGDGTTHITVRDLQTKAGGTMTASIAKSADHALSATTNRLLYDTCELNALTVDFPAQDLRGVATLVAGTVTVTMAGVATTSRISAQRMTSGGTLGDSFAITRTAGTSFTLTSKTANATVAGDTSTVIYQVEPA